MNTFYPACVPVQSSCSDIGIDVSKSILDVHVHQTGQTRQFPNTAKGHRQLVAFLKSIHARRIVLEATGGYERAAVVAMVNAGLGVHVAQPQVIRNFAKSLQIKAKNDHIDTAVMARFAHDRADLLMIQKIDKTLDTLHALVVRRDQLVDMQSMEKNRVQQASDKAVLKSINHHLKGLQKQIEGIEKEIDRTIAADAALAAKAAKIKAVTGVGPQTTRMVVACLPELGTVSIKRIHALVGVAPYDMDSGQSKGRRRIAGGRMLVRNMLYMACMSAIMTNPVIATYYRGMRARGLEHKEAMIPCIRKMLAFLDRQVRSLAAPVTPHTPQPALTI